ncbi:YfiT family bacillithiol transferase [Cytobacillus dafuensis]|uniref:Putative metal-dependent hydrolase FSZ17_01310 n=1 Tax=Cytobacillus dafuensis TaxID=1742359 RepID=A0A5B8YZD2_CYTDA|nr:bacillithiol transferase BstA [Cytobacillus dafuensis]QED46052.1 putative metal-dependent hydrolase [Cytobacillus dafuensis]
MVNDRYPIGEFICEENISKDQVLKWMEEIRLLPSQLSEKVCHLSEEELSQPYRENGWTIRQVVHHIADSHTNGYIRFKLALTEDTPAIKPYNQDEWAKLPDSNMPISISLKIIDSLHERWTYLLQSLTDEQLKRAFHHPDSGLVTLAKSIGIYAWHGKHHLAHIRNALN